MAELTLEPYTARLHWHRTDGRPKFDWQRLVADTLERVAVDCEIEGETVIGHIKGLATFPNGGFLRANLVSPELPADVAGAVPIDCPQVVFTVNVLVYGLSHASIAARVSDAAETAADRWGVAVTVEPIDSHNTSHHHH